MRRSQQGPSAPASVARVSVRPALRALRVRLARVAALRERPARASSLRARLAWLAALRARPPRAASLRVEFQAFPVGGRPERAAPPPPSSELADPEETMTSRSEISPRVRPARSDGPVDHYGDGVWYDAEYVHIRADFPLYQGIAQEARGPILELGCGTGRLSFPMAESGAEVLGIDLAAPMIARAEAKRACAAPAVRARLGFEVADMRTLRLRRRFDRVILAFNTIMHMLEDEDLLAVLETARAHLSAGGRFHLDLFTPYPLFPERDPTGRYDPQQMIDPRTGERWIVTENNHYEPRRQINHMRFYYRRADPNGAPVGPERFTEILLRVLFPRELDAFVRRAGFRIVREHEDYARTRAYSARGGLRVVELEAERP